MWFFKWSNRPHVYRMNLDYTNIDSLSLRDSVLKTQKKTILTYGLLISMKWKTNKQQR